MTVFSINDKIFSKLFENSNVDRTALQNMIDAVNHNQYSNAAFSAAVQRGDSLFEVIPHGYLIKLNAAAAYDSNQNSREFEQRGNKFAYQLDENWFKPHGSEPAFLADPRNAVAVLGVITHEVNHNANQSMYDEAGRLRNLPPSSYRPDLTGIDRSVAAVDLAMRAEVRGWYADLNTMRAEVESGRMSTGTFGAKNSGSTVTGQLLLIETAGKAAGLTGDALMKYVEDNGRPLLPRTYLNSYIPGFSQPDTDPAAVRRALGYTPNDPGALERFTEVFGPDGMQTSTAEYGSGMRLTTVIDSWNGGHRETAEILQPDGSYRLAQSNQVTSYNLDGTQGHQLHATYDDRGQVLLTVELDGAHEDADYDYRIGRYDTQGRSDSVTTYHDDGSSNLLDFDQNGAEGWAQTDLHLDTLGRSDWQRTVIDDGGVDWVDYDQTGQNGYATWTTHTNAQGQQDWQRIIGDDGGVDWVDFDQNGESTHAVWSTHTDAEGRDDWRRIVKDDGSVDWTDFDQADQYGHSIWSNHTDAQGREDWQRVVGDDGSVDWIDFDQADQYAHSTWSSHTDAQGREDWRNILLDDGSREWTDFDQSNARADRSTTIHYDAQGREVWQSVVLDDGREDWAYLRKGGGSDITRWFGDALTPQPGDADFLLHDTAPASSMTSPAFGFGFDLHGEPYPGAPIEAVLMELVP